MRSQLAFIAVLAALCSANPLAKKAPSCGGKAVTKILECPSAQAFCSSLLGYAPVTKTFTTTETSIISNTYTRVLGTVVTQAALGVLTVTKTKKDSTTTITPYDAPPCTTAPSTSSSLDVAVAAAVSSADTSCGLDHFRPGAVSSACSCLMTTTTLYTKYIQTTSKTTITTTKTKYSYSSTITTAVTPTSTDYVYPLFNLLTSNGTFWDTPALQPEYSTLIHLDSSPGNFSYYLNGTRILSTNGGVLDVCCGLTGGLAYLAPPGQASAQPMVCSLASDYTLTCSQNGASGFWPDTEGYLNFGDMYYDPSAENIGVMAVGITCS